MSTPRPFGDRPREPEDSTPEQVREAIRSLERGGAAWVRTSVERRIALLEACVDGTRRVADRWVGASLRAKGLEPATAAEGEEWIVQAVCFRALRHLRRSLQEIRDSGRPSIPGGFATGPEGQAVARVFPRTAGERVLHHDVRAGVWLPEGVNAERAKREQAWSYRDGGDNREEGDASPGVCAVLGAGNVGSLPVTDLLYKLFVEDRVVALKMSPVNAYLGPLIEEAFRPLVDRQALRLLYGGAGVGERLCLHPDVDEVHLTGSDRTYEAVVFGSGEEGRRRKEAGRPRLEKRVTAELGNVTPVIVVPGPWEEGDYRAQAVRIASWLVTNAGFNCLTPRVLVQHRQWDGRKRMTEALIRALGEVETRPAYYPGAEDRHRAFLEAHDEARRVGEDAAGRLPWTVIPDLDPDDPDEICFRREAFCGLTGETGVEAHGASEFLARAVAFCNERLWGTLTATILVHPESLENPEVEAALERAVSRLRYGTVTVNLRGEFGYFLMTTPWGGYPGARPGDIQSGTGVVNNALMLRRTEKTVIRGPFRRWRDPFAVTSGVLAGFGRKLAAYEAAPSVPRLAGLAWTALRAKDTGGA